MYAKAREHSENFDNFTAIQTKRFFFFFSVISALK